MVKRQLLFPILIFLVAAIFRLSFLDIKPPHFDEGINGWFCDQMAKNGYYAYDPTNYHGPLHFYVLYVFLRVFGRNLWALRIPVVLASLTTVFWIFLFRRFFGKTIAYLTALGMAISPGYIFYNRYSIHESWLVLFMVMTFWGLLGVLVDCRPPHVWALILGVTGMVLTKETYILHLIAFLCAICVAPVLGKLFPSSPAFTGPKAKIPGKHVIAAILTSLLLIVFFYSGNFRNWSGLLGLFQTFLPWTKTGVEAAGHAKASDDLFPLLPPALTNAGPLRALASFKLNWYWLRLMLRYEWFALVGVLFSIRFIFGGHFALRILAIYSVLVLFFYSIIPYKTPWCMISIAWPFLFLGAAFFQLLVRNPIRAPAFSNKLRILGFAMIVPILGYQTWRSYDLNFLRFDSEKEPYVYVQTFRDYHTLVDPVLRKIAKDPDSKEEMSGLILLNSYFPIPWVLGELTDVGYYSQKDRWPKSLDADFIVVEADKSPEVEKQLKDNYFIDDFRLRDGMDECSAYFRVETFQDVFPGREPDLVHGKLAQ
ncbi:MAG: glycosyltransferase family 39 protein [Verrucomicrobia bacterium]|nr:glycosyltransferase family 39 protein [Verrucomicrobiota bacterium]